MEETLDRMIFGVDPPITIKTKVLLRVRVQGGVEGETLPPSLPTSGKNFYKMLFSARNWLNK